MSLLRRLFVVFGIIGLFVITPVASVYAADSKDTVCVGAGKLLNKTGCTSDGSPAVNTLVSRGINIFSAILGIIAVVMIIIAGLKYILSGGDSGKVASAQNTALYAAIGLVIVAMAQIAVRFVIGRFD